MKSGTIIENKDIFGGFYWPSIARLPNGMLAAVCSGFRFKHVCPFGKVVITYSADEGLTWSQPKVILDTPLDDRDAGITTWGDKVIVTTFNNTKYLQYKCVKDWGYNETDAKIITDYLDKVSDEDEKKYLGSLYSISYDGGYTFVSPKKLPITSPHGFTVLNNGHLFYVGRLYGHSDITGKDEGVEDKIGFITSPDGKHFSEPTWLELPEKELSEGMLFCEPHGIQLKDGKILVHIRVQEKGVFTIYQCESQDNGKTFSIPKLINVKDNINFYGSPPHLLRHSSGVVVLTYGYRQPEYGQRARLSYDNGETWGEEIILTKDGLDWDLGYPASVESKDGSLITVYYQRKSKNAGIYYTKWDLQKTMEDI